MNKTIMLQGSASGVGKSLLTTALCRILYQDGYNVAPFKAINISLNSGVTITNGEMAISQITQARASGIEPRSIMNPFLVKPQKNKLPQVIIKGKLANNKTVQLSYTNKEGLWSVIKQSFDELIRQYEAVILEGAASPAEPGFIQDDVVNIKIAKYANSPIILVGDIGKGGLFASLEGTIAILRRYDPEVAKLIQGFVINKYQGDREYLDLPCQELTRITGIPVLGILPYIENHQIADEDTWSYSDSHSHKESPVLDIAIIKTPTLQNSHEFDPLLQELHIQVRFISDANVFGNPDFVILPGSKNTVFDLQWMRTSGMAKLILEHVREGKAVMGICGGFQMLGKKIDDPDQIESTQKHMIGLGLLDTITTLKIKKITKQSKTKIIAKKGLLQGIDNTEVSGYEIHIGRTQLKGKTATDIVYSDNGWILGTYFHDLFKNDDFRHTILRNIAYKKGVKFASNFFVNPQSDFDRLADVVRKNLDMKLFYQILNKKGV